MNEKTKIPAPLIAIIPLVVLVALLAMVIPIFGSDALMGGSQVSLLVASAVCVALAMGLYNYKWSVLEEGMAKNIKKVTPAIIILLLIGAISGTWMLSGVVPTLISNLTLILAVKHIGSTTTAVLGCMEPLTAVVMGIIFLGESCSPIQALGIGIILVAVTTVIVARNPHELKRAWQVIPRLLHKVPSERRKQ